MTSVGFLVLLLATILSLLYSNSSSNNNNNNKNNNDNNTMMFVKSFSIPLSPRRHVFRIARLSSGSAAAAVSSSFSTSSSSSSSSSLAAIISASVIQSGMIMPRGAPVPIITSTMMTTTRMTTLRMMSNDQLPSSSSNDDVSIVETCRRKIAEALETKDVKVIGAYDDPNGSHISIEVTSALFEGKRNVQRQQLVYKALWEELQGPVHAVDSMICKTPEEKK